MKRILAFICIAACMTALFAGCGGSPDVVINGLDDLEGKRIGVQLGTTGDIFAEDIEGATIERFNKGTDAVLALRQGKVDAVIIDDQPARVFASQNDDIIILEEPFEIESYAICISKDNPGLTAEFNRAIAELKADGTLQAILDYWIGGVEGSAPYQSPSGAARDKGMLVMATNAEFPPYEFIEGGQVVGIDPDFARAICDRLGYDLRIDDINFDAIITAVQSGRADFGAAGMTITEDRLQNIDFTDSYITATQVVIIRK